VYFPRWMTVILLALYICYAGQLTIAGDMTLGMFLADVSVYTQMGQAWGEIYKILLNMQTCNCALRRIVRLENLSTDLSTWNIMSLSSDKKTKAIRGEVKAEGDSCILAIDVMHIEIQGLHMNVERKCNLMGNLKMMQGQLVALVGHAGQGKATLLKVIGKELLPLIIDDDPKFFMPPHLRVLHVSMEPMFFKGSLLENLTLGATNRTDDGKLERIEDICRRLGLREDTMAFLRSNVHKVDWLSYFSQTQRQLCHLARALVANPEVLCIHKPTQVLDHGLTLQVMNCIIEFVRKRGLLQDDSTMFNRRPRTCVFTSCKWENVQHADNVVHVSQQFGIRVMDKVGVTPEMLY